MRFIGSKNNLLSEIHLMIENSCTGAESFCDIFSGTSVVARSFKNKYRILSNDLLHFSYVLQKATIENNKQPQFKKLSKVGFKNPLEYLNDYNVGVKDLKSEPFIMNHYSPSKNNERAYFTKENAIKIDFIRQTIDTWKTGNLINEREYYYLLASLIEAVPFVSNIAGTYGSYLKHWDKRAFKKIKLLPLEVINNGKANKAFNKDSNQLIKSISGDILYIDPPYNARQYLPNYHILETISKYDRPVVYGKTGLRPYTKDISKYCSKKSVLNEFSELIQNAKFKHIVVSYSSEGLMSEAEIRKVLIKNGIKNSYRLKRIPYRRYKHTKGIVKHDLNEFLFFITKK